MTTLVRDIMTEDPVCCTAGTALDAVADLMVEHDCGAIPVVNNLEDRVLVGILTDRDITCRLLAQKIDPLDRRAEHCMTVRVMTVGPNASIEECCHVMEENQIRRVVVADPHRRCVGIVSLDDLVQRTRRPNLVAKVEQCVTRPASLASSVPLPLPAKPPKTARTEGSTTPPSFAGAIG